MKECLQFRVIYMLFLYNNIHYMKERENNIFIGSKIIRNFYTIKIVNFANVNKG